MTDFDDLNDLDAFDDEEATGPEALTPFEFALAGVTPPGSESLSSLRVIEDMQSLLGDMDDASVTHPGLQDFIDSGGVVARRRVRGNRRPHNPVPQIADRAASATFVDITPSDMGRPSEQGDGQAAGVAAVAAESPNGLDHDRSKEPEIQEPIDAVQADLRSVLIEPDPLIGDLGGNPAGEMITGPIAGHLIDQLATGPVESSDDAGGADSDQESGADGDPTTDDIEAEPLADDVVAEPAAKGTTTDRLRDRLGRFGPAVGPHPDPATIGPNEVEPTAPVSMFGAADEPRIVLTNDEDDGRAVAALAAGGVAPGLLDQTSAAGPPMATRAPAMMAAAGGRRPGGTMLALIGAGAAAAILVAGSLWWASSSSSSSTETDDSGAEVAAGPSTTRADIAVDSRSEPAERSTGDDDEPAEFQGPSDADSSSTSTVGSTIRATTGQQTATTASRPTTTRTGPTSSSAETDGTSATTQAVSTTRLRSTTTTAPPTTASTTTAPPTTRATVTTPRPTTLPPERPVYIGDRVTVGDFDGPGLGGVQVSLYVDEDRDGRVDRLVTRASTAGDGSYSFDQPPGCYEVRFSAPAGYRIRSDLSRQYLCLDSGAVAARTDAIAEQLTSAPPSGCLVEEAGSYAGLGVEVYENASNWAPSYTFYTRSGAVVARTRDLGPYDTDGGDPTDREWFGAENGFNHRSVWSVAAERNGIESTRLTCSRDG